MPWKADFQRYNDINGSYTPIIKKRHWISSQPDSSNNSSGELDEPITNKPFKELSVIAEFKASNRIVRMMPIRKLKASILQLGIEAYFFHTRNLNILL